MDSSVFGYLTLISFALVLVLAGVASVFVNRMHAREPTAISEQIGSAKTVLVKLRTGAPMSKDELNYARQILADRSSPMALAIPGTLFALGCFYVFGSLEHLHGARPSERTFLGVIPMFTSTSLAVRLLSSARLKRRLQNVAMAS